MIYLTDKAAETIKEYLKQDLGFRIAVMGAGCNGFTYYMNIEEEVEEDIVLQDKGIKILTDTFSIDYLKNSTVDFVSSNLSSRFVVDNPNAKSCCGCGDSFSV